MPGSDNNVQYSQGYRLEPSSAEDVLLMQETSSVSEISGTGSPEGAISANPSSVFHDRTAGNIWLKQTGTGNTGWVQVSTGSAINGDTGSITGSTVTIYSNRAGLNCGSTVSFANSATTSTLNLSDPSGNTILGVFSGIGTLTGSENSSLGAFNFTALQAAVLNTAVGSRALRDLQNGNSNVAVGVAAMQNCVNNSQCIAIGETVLINNTGNANTVMGYQAALGTGSGALNCIYGSSSTGSLTDGSGNCNYGSSSGALITTGDQNCLYGFNTFMSIDTGSYNIGIGSNAGNANITGNESSNIYMHNGGANGESNTIRIGTQGTGNQQQDTCFIAGIDGSTVTGAQVLCDANGQLGTIVSSQRFKKDIKSIDESTSILNLRPVSFTYKENDTLAYGFIAEEVDVVIPELCLFDKEGDVSSVKYHEMPALLLKEIQRLNERIKILESKVA